MPFVRKMRCLPPSRLQLTDPFWRRYQSVLLESALPTQFEQLVQTKRLENFHRAAAGGQGGHEGLIFNDSDVYKFIEACAYALVANPFGVADEARNAVREKMGLAIEAVAAAQMPDGYIDTYFQLNHPTMRWRNLSAMHEMYCGGHLIEAGVAVFQSLGDRRLLDVAIRFADHVMAVFGPGLRRGYCGHEEIELALVRLAEACSEEKYREFARWLVEERGKSPSPFVAELADTEALAVSPWGPGMLLRDGVFNGEYAQDHAPIREHTEIVGHAVRAMYFYIAATDLADGQDDHDLEAALERIWKNLTSRRMYVTGGLGPSSKNEGFTGDYDLPNLTAYAETCAAVGLIFWGRRLLEMTGNGDYADVVERALYNGAISGISLDGTTYFYDNPLESRGQHNRTPWFLCACCPPNLARLLGSVAEYVAGESADSFYLHIPVGLIADVTFGGIPVRITVESEYPWAGKFSVRVEPNAPVQFALRVRIPDWSEEVETELPGATEEAGYESGYAVFDRQWRPGDLVNIDLGMRAKWIEADPRVRDDLGRVALTRGPLVYCAEAHDAGFAPQLFSADLNAEVMVRPDDRLGGVTVLIADGVREVEIPSDDLYTEAGTTEVQDATVSFIPYYAWNNRGPTEMQVWVRKA